MFKEEQDNYAVGLMSFLEDHWTLFQKYIFDIRTQQVIENPDYTPPCQLKIDTDNRHLIVSKLLNEKPVKKVDANTETE